MADQVKLTCAEITDENQGLGAHVCREFLSSYH